MGPCPSRRTHANSYQPFGFHYGLSLMNVEGHVYRQGYRAGSAMVSALASWWEKRLRSPQTNTEHCRMHLVELPVGLVKPLNFVAAHLTSLSSRPVRTPVLAQCASRDGWALCSASLRPTWSSPGGGDLRSCRFPKGSMSRTDCSTGRLFAELGGGVCQISAFFGGGFQSSLGLEVLVKSWSMYCQG